MTYSLGDYISPNQVKKTVDFMCDLQFFVRDRIPPPRIHISSIGIARLTWESDQEEIVIRCFDGIYTWEHVWKETGEVWHQHEDRVFLMANLPPSGLVRPLRRIAKVTWQPKD